MNAPFVWLYVCFAAGILLGISIDIPPAALIAAFCVAALSFRSASFNVALASQILFFVLLGSCHAQLYLHRQQSELRKWVAANERETTRVEATVLRTPEIARDYYVLIVRVRMVAGQPLDGTARITVTGRAERYPIAGDRIETFVRFRIPRNFRSEGSFDYERYLQKEGIHVAGTVKNSALIRIGKGSRSLRSYVSIVRLHLIRAIAYGFADTPAAVLRALWLDDRTALTSELQQMFIDAGVFHVIAISGFHIAVLLAIGFFALKRLLSFRSALVALSFFLLGYFLLLEGRSSITRSFLVFLIFLFAVLRNEKPNWANILCLSALIQVVLNPFELLDPGYQLTYLSTATIVFVALPMMRVVPIRRGIARAIVSFVIVSVSIQFVLAPYQAAVFHKIPLSSVIANVIAVPASSVLIASGFFVLPASLLEPAIRVAIRPVLNWFLEGCSFFSEFGVLTVSRPQPVVVFLFYGFLLLAVTARRRILQLGFFGASAVLLMFVLFPPPPSVQNQLRVHFIDVGQGDSILIEYPDGAVDLIDGGGFWNTDALDTGTSILLPYLSYFRLGQIDRVFLSHAHSDHMNGLSAVFRYFPVREFLMTRLPYGERQFRAFLQSVGRSPKAISAGYRYNQGGVTVSVLSPDDCRHTSKVANDDSLVMLLEYGENRILLTGDAERNTEERLAPPGPIDFLKVAHHGSKTSTTARFLESIRPKHAFISAGRNNWFGHPHPDVLKRLREAHTVVLRTDQIGTIRLTIRPSGNFSIDSYVWSKSGSAFLR